MRHIRKSTEKLKSACCRTQSHSERQLQWMKAFLVIYTCIRFGFGHSCCCSMQLRGLAQWRMRTIDNTLLHYKFNDNNNKTVVKNTIVRWKSQTNESQNPVGKFQYTHNRCSRSCFPRHHQPYHSVSQSVSNELWISQRIIMHFPIEILSQFHSNLNDIHRAI